MKKDETSMGLLQMIIQGSMLNGASPEDVEAIRRQVDVQIKESENELEAAERREDQAKEKLAKATREREEAEEWNSDANWLSTCLEARMKGEEPTEANGA